MVVRSRVAPHAPKPHFIYHTITSSSSPLQDLVATNDNLNTFLILRVFRHSTYHNKVHQNFVDFYDGYSVVAFLTPIISNVVMHMQADDSKEDM
jgi:hypothetical protein